jgi:hypothetical protein
MLGRTHSRLGASKSCLRAFSPRTLLACAGMLASLALAPHASASGGCTRPSEDLIARQFDRWNRALASGSPDAVAGLYADNAVLRVAGRTTPIIGRPPFAPTSPAS